LKVKTALNINNECTEEKLDELIKIIEDQIKPDENNAYKTLSDCGVYRVKTNL